MRPGGSEAALKPGNVQGMYVSPTRKLLKRKQEVEAVHHIGHENGRRELGKCHRAFW